MFYFYNSAYSCIVLLLELLLDDLSLLFPGPTRLFSTYYWRINDFSAQTGGQKKMTEAYILLGFPSIIVLHNSTDLVLLEHEYPWEIGSVLGLCTRIWPSQGFAYRREQGKPPVRAVPPFRNFVRRFPQDSSKILVASLDIRIHEPFF